MKTFNYRDLVRSIWIDSSVNLLFNWWISFFFLVFRSITETSKWFEFTSWRWSPTSDIWFETSNCLRRENYELMDVFRLLMFWIWKSHLMQILFKLLSIFNLQKSRVNKRYEMNNSLLSFLLWLIFFLFKILWFDHLWFSSVSNLYLFLLLYDNFY